MSGKYKIKKIFTFFIPFPPSTPNPFQNVYSTCFCSILSLVFRPKHTHNYKSLYDARQSLRQMSKQPINLWCPPSLEFPPPKNGMGWKGGGRLLVEDCVQFHSQYTTAIIIKKLLLLYNNNNNYQTTVDSRQLEPSLTRTC